MAELLAAMETTGYITRQTVIKPKCIRKAKKAMKQAFVYQLENRCFSFVELISTCPTNWGMTPVEAVQWAEEAMLPYNRLGDYKTPETTELENQPVNRAALEEGSKAVMILV